MKSEYSIQALSCKWSKLSEGILPSGKLIRIFSSNDRFSAILVGTLIFEKEDPFAKPILTGSFTLLSKPSSLDQKSSLEYDAYDVLSSEDIVDFLIEELNDL